MWSTGIFKQRGRLALAVLALASLALVAAACSDDDDDDIDAGQPVAGLSAGQLESLVRSASSGTGFGGSSSGIAVTGVGTISVEPDVAILTLGVEAFASTVAEARDTAAEAITGILAVLDDAGIDEDDIATQFFNIQPEYTFDRIIEERIERSERRLVGYRVTNTLSVKVRDFDRLSDVIDGSVTAGGDAVRVNGISFTLEDGAEFEAQARVLAVQDAMAKAKVFADETGVERGKLVFITESSFPQFGGVAEARSLARPAFDGAFAPTPIVAGKLDVRVSVQAVFSID